MGTFDIVRFQFPLLTANSHLQNLRFQTKSLPERNFYDYVVKEDGTLWLEYRLSSGKIIPIREDFSGEMLLYGNLNKDELVRMSASFKEGELTAFEWKIEKNPPRLENTSKRT